MADLERIERTLTSRHWSWLEYSTPNPSTVIAYLAAKLPHIEFSSWPERLDWGGVFVNGHAVLSDATLPTPCKVEYYEPKYSLGGAADLFPQVTEDHIVYRDADLLVAFKPAKLPTMPAKEQRHFSLKQGLERLTGATIHVASRLDVSVSGLVAVSLSKRMHAPLQQAYETRSVTKEYLLFTHGNVNWDAVNVAALLGPDDRHPVLRRVVENGDVAETLFEHAGRIADGGSAFRAFPRTGRTHQIRIHAAWLGYPIDGDNFYGGAEAAELHLLCRRVRLYQPFLARWIDVSAPPRHLPPWTVRLGSGGL